MDLYKGFSSGDAILLQYPSQPILTNNILVFNTNMRLYYLRRTVMDICESAQKLPILHKVKFQ